MTTKHNQPGTTQPLAQVQPTPAPSPGGEPPGSGQSPAPDTPPPLPPNAFRGRPERVPEIVYVNRPDGDAFLTSARRYYQHFGLDVRAEIRAVTDVVSDLAAAGPVLERFAIVSHAHPRGMVMPFFRGAVNGTDKEFFREFAISDLAGLLFLSPLPPGHLFNWSSIRSDLLDLVRGRPGGTAALQPFDTHLSTADVSEFLRFCFDIVYLRNPGRVRRNPGQAGGLTGPQRTILESFVNEILTQMKPGIVTSRGVTAAQVEALRKAVIGADGLTYTLMGPLVGDFHPDLGLQNDSINDFPSLQAAVTAIQGGFRTALTDARRRINASTLIDIRGCRVGTDPDYLEAVREFFGTGPAKPAVTAPRWFQTYPQIAWHPIADRAGLRTWINGTQWLQTSDELKTAFRNWAELIRVNPLHTDFWRDLLRGRAVRFGGLTWRSEIPALFIPTPGLAALAGLSLQQVIGRLQDFFDVPNASVPAAAVLTGLNSITTNLPTWSGPLLTPVTGSTSAPQRTTLFDNLKQINTALGQAFVPAASPNAPNPPTSGQLTGYQTALVNHLESQLAPIKTFMTAAADSLQNGDGLHFYLIFAGLPVFVHGTPELDRNGLVVHDTHRAAALQSWYKCLWKDPLPATGPYTTANIATLNHRQVIALVGEDRTSYLSICPIPAYMNCIRKRPLPAGENESLCPS